MNSTAGIDYITNPYYDYSLIPGASGLNGTGTRGLKMTANNSAGILGELVYRLLA